MTDTYRLPDSLGGHECEIVPGSEWDTGVVTVRTTVDGVAVAAQLPGSLLTKVELPPEPPVGSVVGVEMVDTDPEEGSVFRRYKLGWAVPGDAGDDAGDYMTWPDLCSYGSTLPVLLVPDPAAGVEPSGEWGCQADGADANLRVAPTPHDGDLLVGVYVFGKMRDTLGSVWLSREDAEAAGRTLLAAAAPGVPS